MTTTDDDIDTITDAEHRIIAQYDATILELESRLARKREVGEQIKDLRAEVKRLARVVRVIDPSRLNGQQPDE